MTDRELRRLRRGDLLKLMIEQGRQIQSLEQKLECCRQEQKERKILLENAGSIADAALSLSDVFDAAQHAADLYSENAQRRCEERIADREREIDLRLSQAREQLNAANVQAEQILDEARKQALQIKAEAHAESARIREEALVKSRKMDEENYGRWEDILRAAHRDAQQIIEDAKIRNGEKKPTRRRQLVLLRG